MIGIEGVSGWEIVIGGGFVMISWVDGMEWLMWFVYGNIIRVGLSLKLGFNEGLSWLVGAEIMRSWEFGVFSKILLMI